MIERTNRISKMLSKELSLILQQDTDEWWAQFVSIRHIDMTKDLGLAKIYYALTCDDKRKDSVKENLTKYAGVIRRSLASRVSMKFIPELSFREDTFDQYKSNLDSIFDRINTERKNSGNQ